jgi:hypothetical protein
MVQGGDPTGTGNVRSAALSCPVWSTHQPFLMLLPLRTCACSLVLTAHTIGVMKSAVC